MFFSSNKSRFKKYAIQINQQKNKLKTIRFQQKCPMQWSEIIFRIFKNISFCSFPTKIFHHQRSDKVGPSSPLSITGVRNSGFCCVASPRKFSRQNCSALPSSATGQRRKRYRTNGCPFHLLAAKPHINTGVR